MLPFIIAAADPYAGAGLPSFFGFMGIACSLVFANLGAAYGTAKSGVGISSMGVLKPDKIIQAIIPVVMAGILGIYGLIVSVILIGKGKIYESNNFSFWRRLHIRKRILSFSFWTLLWTLLFGNQKFFNSLGCWYCYWNSRRCWC